MNWRISAIGNPKQPLFNISRVYWILKDIIVLLGKILDMRYKLMARPLIIPVFFLLLATGFFSCSSNLETGSINLENWKSDRNGCKGLRIQDLKEIEKLRNTFLEANNQQLIKTFGRPDRVELLDKSQSFFYYFLEPSDACGGLDEKEPLKVLFRLNAINRVSEVTVTTLDPF